MGAPEPIPQSRVILSVNDALNWGDEWVSAYAALQSHTEQLEHQVFMLQTRAVILEAEALLLRYDMQQALARSTETP